MPPWQMRTAMQFRGVGKPAPAVDTVASPVGEILGRKSRLFVKDRGTSYQFLVDSGADISILSRTKTKGEVTTIQENYVLSTVNRASKYFNLLNSYPDLTRPNLVNKIVKHGVEHSILTTSKPVYSKTRQLAPDKLKLAKQEFQFMLDNNIIRPSKSQWASPLHLVNKKNGTLRSCGDYRRLNAQTVPDWYLIPRIEDFNYILKDKIIFSKIDLEKATIPVAEEDKEKTAITTPFGLYKFNTMSFELRNAPSTFHHRSTVWIGFSIPITRLCTCCLIFRRGAQGTSKNSITAEGSRPLPEKVEAIINYKLPSTIHDLRTFLGLINFFRRYLKDAAKTQAPLHELLKEATKKDRKKVPWTDNTRRNFEKCKTDFTEAALLSFPRNGILLSLSTDASDFTVGSVLQQFENDGWKPTAFYSKKLNDTQRRIESVSTTDYDAIAEKQVHDKELQQLMQESSSLQFQPSTLLSGKTLWYDISTSNIRPYIPEEFRMQIFQQMNGFCHPGVKSTIKKFIWPEMKKQVGEWAKTCMRCQKCKVNRHIKSKFGIYQIQNGSFSVEHIDLIGPLPPSEGMEYCLTCIDHYSSWIEAVTLPAITAEIVDKAFYNKRICRFGVPAEITTESRKTV
ncbi:retrovirus-related Pol polyprotein from transposon 297 [Nephila pilipes]|uniref:RNA-directed DNA polymerase n=1 Tax=Nephila pilipes TaxID=299642 RepID=A0A8X6MQ73_NEPPI|nr:retrovirus-related Pol polyprotein from transposon 297 [Nephila pilipes]GFS71967.1 retrovirus-related Pol polyprotein from transposon 297 [Nephila pilipes]